MKVFGIIGDPVDHSLSPVLFNAAFKATKTEAVYGTFHVSPEDLEDAISGAKALGVQGLNVTTPHKEAVLAFVEPDDEATAIDAVNAIDLTANPPVGWNTDVMAMRAVLDALDTESGVALVLGAGGAAQAYTYALDGAGWQLIIANRTHERAQRLAQKRAQASAIKLTEATAWIDEADLILNATTVGLDEPDRTPIDPTRITSDHVVIDAIYGEHDTRLVREARAAGAHCISGGHLLLLQAVGCFERWIHTTAPQETMAKALDDALGAYAGV